MCRIETGHVDLESHAAFVRAAFMNPETHLWKAGFYSVREEDAANPGGPLAFVTYVAQPNQDLPAH
jgi:hypothetical protein